MVGKDGKREPNECRCEVVDRKRFKLDGNECEKSQLSSRWWSRSRADEPEQQLSNLHEHDRKRKGEMCRTSYVNQIVSERTCDCDCAGKRKVCVVRSLLW